MANRTTNTMTLSELRAAADAVVDALTPEEIGAPSIDHEVA